LTTNFARALTLTLTIITGLLFWLSSFMLNDSILTNTWQKLPAGEWLVPTILFISAVPMAWIVIKNLIPSLFAAANQGAVRIVRFIFTLVFMGILILGFIH
jgi:hypothetical protein